MNEVEYKRLWWHSRRGMLELDLVLLPFVENHLRDAPGEIQAAYRLLLEEEDQSLYRWLIGSERPGPDELAMVVSFILASR